MPNDSPVFGTVLIANRGEIAVRVARTLRRLGIRVAAVYSDADEAARHVRVADVAVRIGPPPAAQSYLDIDSVVGAAKAVGAEAVHPGYGFLSENAAFARACAEAGIVFIGPPPSAIEAMGDKIRAKQTVEDAGVPVVPGRHTVGLGDDDLAHAATQIGYPVLLKPSAGGGGKGMRRVDAPEGIAEAIAAARREARTAFGDDALLIERYVSVPRHIEVQVVADQHGNVIHLGERECSLQRRHQKVIEETPSPLLDGVRRDAMGASAVRTAQACGYVGAGTVEFIVSADRPEEFFFMEMNTRLQVEHPVTEMVTGVDLVELQLRVAAGQPLDLQQKDVRLSGHAVEARIYAEDPTRAFLPTGGTVLRLAEPIGEHVRVDSGLDVGTVVGADYDPMLSKVIAWGDNRAAALDRLDQALADCVLLGVTNNVGFLRGLLADGEVRAGHLDTGLIERVLPRLVADPFPGDVALAATAASLLEREQDLGSDDPFEALTDWRMGGRSVVQHRWSTPDGTSVVVHAKGDAEDAAMSVVQAVGPGSVDGVRVTAKRRDDGLLEVTHDGASTQWAYARAGAVRWLGRAGYTWAVKEGPAHEVSRPSLSRATGPLRAPMPGMVTAVHAAEGDTVVSGQAVVSIEAMKMEHVVRASADGVVGSLQASRGDQVALDQILATITPPEEPSSE